MNPISIFEHEGFREPISESGKMALDGLRGPRNEKLFAVGWKEVQATSFVGVVQLGTRVIQVLPKMYSRQLAVEHNVAECRREATANLLFLLSRNNAIEKGPPIRNCLVVDENNTIVGHTPGSPNGGRKH